MTDYEILENLEIGIYKAIKTMFNKALEHTPEHIRGIIVNSSEKWDLDDAIEKLFSEAKSDILRSGMRDVAERERRQLQFITEVIPKLTENKEKGK